MIQCEECGEPITRQQVPLCDQCKIDRIFVRNDLEMIAKAQAGLAKYVALSLLPQVKWVDDDECNEMYRKELTISLGEQLKEQANGRT